MPQKLVQRTRQSKSTQSNVRVSLIIPIKNEAATIEKFQESLSHLEDVHDVIFVDGGSTDSTRERINPAYQVISSAPGRAVQMNAGARRATGEVLWFLHSDSKLDPTSIQAIQQAVATHPLGCFHIRFWSPQARTNSLMKMVQFFSNLRVKMRNIAFGDQGIFVTRALFDELGGYEEIPLMEDYEFSLQVRERGYTFYQLPQYLTTSARRYDKNGVFSTILLMWRLQLTYLKARRLMGDEKATALQQIAVEYERGKKT